MSRDHYTDGQLICGRLGDIEDVLDRIAGAAETLATVFELTGPERATAAPRESSTAAATSSPTGEAGTDPGFADSDVSGVEALLDVLVPAFQLSSAVDLSAESDARRFATVIAHRLLAAWPGYLLDETPRERHNRLYPEDPG